MIYLMYNMPLPRGIRTFKLDTSIGNVPSKLLYWATLVVEGKPEGVIKDRHGMFDGVPPDTIQAIELWLPR